MIIIKKNVRKQYLRSGKIAFDKDIRNTDNMYQYLDIPEDDEEYPDLDFDFGYGDDDYELEDGEDYSDYWEYEIDDWNDWNDDYDDPDWGDDLGNDYEPD